MRETLKTRRETELSELKEAIRQREEAKKQEKELDVDFRMYEDKSDSSIITYYRKLNHKLVDHLTAWIN